MPLISFLISIFSGFLIAQKVECYTQFGACPQYIQQMTPNLVGYPLYRPLPSAQIKSQLISFPEIEAVKLYRRLPHTLVVSITLRRPIGAVTSSVLGVQTSLVDEQGTLFSTAENTSLPLLVIEGDLSPGTRLSADYLQVLRLLEKAGTITSSRIIATYSPPQTLTLHLPGSLQVILDTQNSPDNWPSSLQLILARSKIGDKIPRKIDLRYTNPVVSYED